ncbi:MAG TPA: hydantoinase/oxoprolinase family protein [Dehalococcoidia bacterium]|nr:hydantoinase/oxoprolinase family protein [Dehalococcoidia bacterium]
MMRKKDVIILGSDAGGTMTDMLMVDRLGDFVVGKAATTPHDESIGFINSLADAFQYWGMNWDTDAKDVVPGIQSTVYCGTGMLNALLTRTGKKVGILITKGFEDTLLHERGAQIHAGYGYQDKIHKVAHVHNKPLVPRKLIKGVTERISIVFGEEVIPVYEDEARAATAELLDRGVEGIAILCLHSYSNPAHEQKIAEIAREVMKKKGRRIPLYLSSELMPVWRECSRLNATVLQAYGAEPVREHLFTIEQKLRDKGYKYPLQIVLADGGIANIRYPALFKACFSGPIGGLLGGRYLSQVMDIPNLLCTDMGGTSFDVGLIMGGEPVMLREVEVGRAIVNIPTLVMNSIGAGTGQYVTIDPESKRLEIGPGSAGADPGPVCYNMGNDIPTVMDCLLIMGILNPDYYLGGKIKLHTDLALKAIKEKCADPLGVDPYRFAEGIFNLISTRMRDHITTSLSVWGYSPTDYYLIGYGGAGPVFLSDYSHDLPFKGVFTVPWAAAFSAFGCCAADYLHRYQKSTMVVLLPGADEATKVFMGTLVNACWEELERIAVSEMEEEGFKREDITLRHIAYVRYMMQLEDVEVISPVSRINTAADMDKLINAFEDTYSRKYAHAAKYPEVGYQIMELGLHAMVSKPKPRLGKYPPVKLKKPSIDAFRGRRNVYRGGTWKTAALYEMDRLQNGHEVEGLAILEAPTTTMLVPQGKKAVIDEYKRVWLKEV